ncbi:type II toxin-antitoxin system HicB family antitoxin [Calditerricola satsumensis]|uniref:type II toxin-antitoxin system HicB family antitoxin n=1 Tax=Calditerricola satsumensis TaxID=373054 RepID=UPI0035713220
MPYTIMLQKIRDESGEYYFARVLELDGCQSDGDTPEEALKNIREAMEGYLEVKLEYGDPIPEPVPESQAYSGQFRIRIPKSLHQRLVIEAQREGVSLNQYVLYKLSK